MSQIHWVLGLPFETQPFLSQPGQGCCPGRLLNSYSGLLLMGKAFMHQLKIQQELDSQWFMWGRSLILPEPGPLLLVSSLDRHGCMESTAGAKQEAGESDGRRCEMAGTVDSLSKRPVARAALCLALRMWAAFVHFEMKIAEDTWLSLQFG